MEQSSPVVDTGWVPSFSCPSQSWANNFAVTTTQLVRFGAVAWFPLGDQLVAGHDGHRVRLAYNNCSTVIGNDLMRRPVA
jgi:hypothetical protein